MHQKLVKSSADFLMLWKMRCDFEMPKMSEEVFNKTDFSNISIRGQNIDIQFHIISPINVITGDSATGKSKMINDLGMLLEEHRLGGMKLESSFPVDFIKIMDSGSMLDKDFSRFSGGPYLIFIDNFDRYDSKELRDFIFKTKNVFCIISRGSLLGSVSKRGWYSLKSDGKSYRLVSFIRDGDEFMKLLGYED